jgi:hypothetical protein
MVAISHGVPSTDELPMTALTYRVRRRRINDTEVGFGLVETFVTLNGAGHTERNMAPTSVMAADDPDADRKAIVELQDQLVAMLDALSRPVLSDGDTIEPPAPGSIEDRRPEDIH